MDDRDTDDTHRALELALAILPSPCVALVHIKHVFGEAPGTVVPRCGHRGAEEIRIVHSRTRLARLTHSKPCSAKLVYRSPATIIWSKQGMPRMAPDATICSVTRRSS